VVGADLVAATYDGDTAPDDRTWARANANVLLTNPDMLHAGILPSHARWATYLMRLRYVVVDELHALRGLFGSHVAHVLRRLRRLCAYYGADPVFCFTSATIGNPGALAAQLCGLPVEAIDDDGAPVPARPHVATALLDEHTGTGHRQRNRDALARFVERGHQSLAFTAAVAARSRWPPRRGLVRTPPRAPPLRRRRLPQATFRRSAAARNPPRQEVWAGSSPSALELGIDISSRRRRAHSFRELASMRQQVGRAGRGSRRAAVLVAATTS
jgi:DEAD/DEAH box helicase domain-containing protein